MISDSRKKDSLYCIICILAALIIYLPGLSVHGLEYRDDEIFYYRSTMEMVETGDILSPKYFGEDRFQKPILYYWIILLGYKIFGPGWFAARFFSVLFAGLSVAVTWLLAKELFNNKKIAHLSAGILLTTPLFFRHAKNAVPDMPLNFFIVLALFWALRLSKNPSDMKYQWAFFITCGIGFMIKGFAALIIPILTVLALYLWMRKPRLLKYFRFGRGLLILLAIILPWFLYMISVHGKGYFEYMVMDETSKRLWNVEQGNPIIVKSMLFLEHLRYYFLVILSHFAPWSLFGIFALGWGIVKRKNEDEEQLKWLLSWVFVVLFFFSFMYFTISHYMLTITTPMAILVSYFLFYPLSEKAWLKNARIFFQKYMVMFFITLGFSVYGIFIIFLLQLSKVWDYTYCTYIHFGIGLYPTI